MGVQQSLAPLPDEKTTELFLRAAFDGKPEDARILVWTIPDKFTRTFTDVEAAITYVGECVDHRDVYFGIGTGVLDIKKDARYKATQISGLIGFHIDLDVDDPEAHKKKSLPPTKGEALAFVQEIGLEPTFIVDSGHGFQVHWLFEVPWTFENSAERDTASQYNRWWQQYARGLAMKNHAWEVDSTPDLSRVLRVPGSINWKVVDHPVPVNVVAHNPQARYSIAQFLDVLEANQEIAKLPKVGVSVEISARDLEGRIVLREDAEPPALKFGKLTRENKLAYDAFEHEIDQPSGSEYDFKLAIAALRQMEQSEDGLMYRTWSDQEVADLLIAHRRKWGFDLKRPGYYALTITKALAEINKEDKLVEVNATLDDNIKIINEAKAKAHEQLITDDADAEGDEEEDEDEDEASSVASSVDDSDSVKFSPEDIQRMIARRKEKRESGAPAASNEASNITPITAPKTKKAKQASGIVAIRASINVGAAEGEEARQAILNGLSDIYNPINFVDIVKILSDPPQYRFTFNVHGKETSLTLKGLSSVVEIRQFRVSVAGATDQLMPLIKQQDWDKHVQSILSAARTEEIGEEATDVGLVNSWLNGYVESATIDYNWSGEYIDEGLRTIVPYKGDYFFFMSDIIYWLRVHRNERVSPQSLGALFRTRGMDFVALPMTRGKGRTTKSAWYIPPNIMAPFLESEKKYGI